MAHLVTSTQCWVKRYIMMIILLLIGSRLAPTTCKSGSLRRNSLTSVVTSAGAATRGTALIIDTGTSARTPPAQDVKKLIKISKHRDYSQTLDSEKKNSFLYSLTYTSLKKYILPLHWVRKISNFFRVVTFKRNY